MCVLLNLVRARVRARQDYDDMAEEALDMREEKRFERKFVKKAKDEVNDDAWAPPPSKKKKPGLASASVSNPLNPPKPKPKPKAAVKSKSDKMSSRQRLMKKMKLGGRR